MSYYSDEDKRVFDWLRAGASYVAVVGSRNLPNEERERVATFIGMINPDATIVTGGAPGVDTWAEDLAAERGLRCAVVRPSRKGYHLAGDYMTRNTVIVWGAQVVVAFWDGESRGTWDSIYKAIEHHGYCIVVKPGEPPQICRGDVTMGEKPCG